MIKNNYYERIKRILVTLNLTGFRIYAIELVKHLEREMSEPLLHLVLIYLITKHNV